MGRVGAGNGGLGGGNVIQGRVRMQKRRRWSFEIQNLSGRKLARRISMGILYYRLPFRHPLDLHSRCDDGLQKTTKAMEAVVHRAVAACCNGVSDSEGRSIEAPVGDHGSKDGSN